MPSITHAITGFDQSSTFAMKRTGRVVAHPRMIGSSNESWLAARMHAPLAGIRSPPWTRTR